MDLEPHHPEDEYEVRRPDAPGNEQPQVSPGLLLPSGTQGKETKDEPQLTPFESINATALVLFLPILTNRLNKENEEMCQVSYYVSNTQGFLGFSIVCEIDAHCGTVYT